MGGAHDLVQALRSTQTGWASTDNEDINIAVQKEVSQDGGRRGLKGVAKQSRTTHISAMVMAITNERRGDGGWRGCSKGAERV